MKSLTLLTLALALSACAHETTTLDRELALKLADRPQVIVTPSQAPINVNNYNGGQQHSPSYQPDASVSALPVNDSPFAQIPVPSGVAGVYCFKTRIFDLQGNFDYWHTSCN